MKITILKKGLSVIMEDVNNVVYDENNNSIIINGGYDYSQQKLYNKSGAIDSEKQNDSCSEFVGFGADNLDLPITVTSKKKQYYGSYL